MLTKSSHPQVYLIICNRKLVYAIINVKDKWSPGIDIIKEGLLKQDRVEICKPHTILINKIIEDGKWSTALKIGIIKSLFKGGINDDISNYRPITIISNIAKIFVKILKVKMYSYPSKNKLEFKKRKSINDAIRSFELTIYNGLDNRYQT